MGAELWDKGRQQGAVLRSSTHANGVSRSPALNGGCSHFQSLIQGTARMRPGAPSPLHPSADGCQAHLCNQTLLDGNTAGHGSCYMIMIYAIIIYYTLWYTKRFSHPDATPASQMH